MTINCIIVDDEPLAIRLIEDHINKIDGLTLVGKAQNAMEAYSILRRKSVDLMFLDIQMPNLNGISFLKSLERKPKTIFTTAYREYAVEGFELEAVDYILKPITFERFLKAVDRILRNDIVDDSAAFIVLKSMGFQQKILLEEIVYFESQGNDIKVVLSNNNSFSSKYTMSDLELVLAPKGFVRIHRSFIINPKFVTAFNQTEILLGNHTIPVGRSYKKEYETFTTDISTKRLL